MDRTAAIWLRREAARNLHRIPSYYDFDDLVSEGLECWSKIVTRYHNVTAPAHRMALFMTTFKNRITDLERKRDRDLGATLESDMGFSLDDDAEFSMDMLPGDDEQSLAVAMAPASIRQFVQAMSGCAYPQARKGVRESNRGRLLRVAGISPVVQEQYERLLASYLKESAR